MKRELLAFLGNKVLIIFVADTSGIREREERWRGREKREERREKRLADQPTQTLSESEIRKIFIF